MASVLAEIFTNGINDSIGAVNAGFMVNACVEELSEVARMKSTTPEEMIFMKLVMNYYRRESKILRFTTVRDFRMGGNTCVWLGVFCSLLLQLQVTCYNLRYNNNNTQKQSSCHSYHPKVVCGGGGRTSFSML